MNKFRVGAKVKAIKYVYDGFPINSEGEVQAISFTPDSDHILYYVSNESNFSGWPMYGDELEQL